MFKGAPKLKRQKPNAAIDSSNYHRLVRMKDTVYLILPYLNMIEKMSIVRAFPWWRPYMGNFAEEFACSLLGITSAHLHFCKPFSVEDNGIENIINNLKEFTITGSLVVRELNKMQFSFCDVDLLYKSNLEPYVALQKLCNFSSKQASCWTDKSKSEYYEVSGNVLSFDNYCDIIVTSETERNFVNTFDLDICSVYVSPTQVYVKNPVALLKKHATINVDQLQLRNPYRLLNIEKLSQRIQKYKTRGFSIDVIYDWHTLTQCIDGLGLKMGIPQKKQKLYEQHTNGTLKPPSMCQRTQSSGWINPKCDCVRCQEEALSFCFKKLDENAKNYWQARSQLLMTMY